jgi:predicted nucleic acid-binding protein
MRKTSIVADSSFFICFLDDIKEFKTLIKLLKYDKFVYLTGKIIEREIRLSKNFNYINQPFEYYVSVFKYYNYEKIIEPFLSIKEIKKGEHEAIVIAYIIEYLNKDFIVILDEEWARNYFVKNFPNLTKNLKGTVGFLKFLTVNHDLILHHEAIKLLEKIKKSKFRIKNNIINRIIKIIKKDYAKRY